MDSMQQDVLEFHRQVVEIPDQTEPGIRRPELRAKLIAEEARETIEAILGKRVTLTVHEDDDRPQSLPDAIDGICDLVYVALGAALEFGIDLEPFWNEVQRSNMAKAGGPVREDGKKMKPEGWRPPNIEYLLERAKELADPSFVCSSTIPKFESPV